MNTIRFTHYLGDSIPLRVTATISDNKRPTLTEMELGSEVVIRNVTCLGLWVDIDQIYIGGGQFPLRRILEDEVWEA